MANKKTVFLTGATGLVGSYLLKLLLQEGYKVYALARGKDNKNARDRDSFLKLLECCVREGFLRKKTLWR